MQSEFGCFGHSAEGQGGERVGDGGFFGLRRRIGAADSEPCIVQLLSGLRQLEAEKAVYGLFQGFDGFRALFGGGLFPGNFEAFKSSSEFKALCLCGGLWRDGGQ
jgi:hypothetical protein